MAPSTPPPAEQRAVGGVDDGVDVEPRDVAHDYRHPAAHGRVDAGLVHAPEPSRGQRPSVARTARSVHCAQAEGQLRSHTVLLAMPTSRPERALCWRHDDSPRRPRGDAASRRGARWLARRPDVPACWFLHDSRLHGVSHTQRVHVHAQRLIAGLGWTQADGELVLRAALWHDIGRHGDGVEPGHGASSVARADELAPPRRSFPADAAVVRFAILTALPARRRRRRSWRRSWRPVRSEARRLAEPERALRVLWLLKDADALDRVRLGWGECADPRQLRHARGHRAHPVRHRSLRRAGLTAGGGRTCTTVQPLVHRRPAARPRSHANVHPRHPRLRARRPASVWAGRAQHVDPAGLR